MNFKGILGKGHSKNLHGTIRICIFSGCEIAISPPGNSSFNIERNIKSEIYPVSVKQDGEDIYVQLKDYAPDVEISSINLNQTTSFNYKREGDRLIIPEKFKHIRLHNKSSEDIDIIYKMAAAGHLIYGDCATQVKQCRAY